MSRYAPTAAANLMRRDMVLGARAGASCAAIVKRHPDEDAIEVTFVRGDGTVHTEWIPDEQIILVRI